MSQHDPLAKLSELGLTLPDDPGASANYIPFKAIGETLYLSGQGPRASDGTWILGTIGGDVTVAEAYGHARTVGLQLLAVASKAAGGLHLLEVVKVFGMVNAVAGFADHPKVINGCSDLFVDVLGERGRHARSAVGMGSLPNRMTVEIEAIMRILPEEEC
ncbi:RidA family protein [Mesorhizobium sp. VK23B]|uniref:RidA family protein n=1 Tax=Mesorhizobium dulcispinae TaxID=3072316 RepID=A0ABU4X9N5_9HYPH|nr:MULTISPECIES: RidA family protein [unclassified Mesorhizobium]MDX8465688.1 RidA family protein [Mesorhizobium sp. VK23B]MDX8471510.1 RidA family protein [Mesorhizobium sp. VK23A]